MNGRGALLAWLAVTILIHEPGRAEEIFFEDDRMIQANALLSERHQYPRAIALYRDVIDEFPSHATARLWLARVLSWSGAYDDSLAEYDTLMTLDPPAADLDLERAEVLSWAGRYDEALDAFDRILSDRPDQRRALIGKARAYSYSGQRAEAARTYEAALSLGDDAETRNELAGLRASLGAGGDARGNHFFDSDGFFRTTVLSTAAVDLDFNTRVITDLAFRRAGRDQNNAILAGLGTPTATNGVEGLIGLERQLTPEVVARAQVGYAWWEFAPGQFQARAAVEAYLPTDSALGFQLDYGSFLDWSDSYEALAAGINGTNLRGSIWQGLTQHWSVFGYAETTFISDSNTRFAAGASVDYRPLESVNLLFGITADALTYTQSSTFYYDPSLDVGASTYGRIDHPVREWLGLFAEASVGMGHAEQGDLTGFGLTYGVEGGARAKRGSLELELLGGRRQSQRSTIYTSYNAGARLKLEF